MANDQRRTTNDASHPADDRRPTTDDPSHPADNQRPFLASPERSEGTNPANDQRRTTNDAVSPDDRRPFLARPERGEGTDDDSSPDELWMQEALRCAQRALEIGEVPVGAVVVCQGRIVGRGWNRNIADSDPTAHAEIVALREAAATVGNHRLVDCDLFATIEPCPMCAGAMVHARIRRLVYGADDPKAGAVHSTMHLLDAPHLNHHIEVQSGVLAARTADLLQSFFRNRR